MSKTGITVKLIDRNGGAFSILSAVKREMQHAKIPVEVIEAYVKEATSGDYHHLIATTIEYVDVI